MNLEAQISLITVPQEFMRLCNAVLAAQHGDDFLPIDDDTADRGNDGYLKSERRLFAAHCFKRVQNQSIEKDIRSKMVGDLGKAIALKQQGIWDIAAWTFLSNYPVPDAIAAEVVGLGRDAGIDVSWRGPDFFAIRLQQHPEIRDRFPDLQVNRISEQLSDLRAAVASLGEADANRRPDRRFAAPRTRAEQDELLLERPPAWEYLLFAGVLLQGKARLEVKWHDHEMALPRGARRRLEGDDPGQFLGNEVHRLAAMIDPMMRVLEPSAQELAFGAPGTAGDPVRIEHLAGRILTGYEEMLDWAAGLRSVEPPDRYARLFSIAARMADAPLIEMRRFIDEVVERLEGAADHVADPDPDKGVLTIELDLVLRIDQEVQRELYAEIDRLS